MITVVIDGVGKFQVPREMLNELLDWLNRAQAVAIKNEAAQYNGRELINE